MNDAAQVTVVSSTPTEPETASSRIREDAPPNAVLEVRMNRVIAVAINPRDAEKFERMSLPSSPVWSSSDDTVATVVPSRDGRSAQLITKRKAGLVIVRCAAADGSEGADLFFDVIEDSVSSFNIGVGLMREA